jgi:hypothetical protein
MSITPNLDRRLAQVNRFLEELPRTAHEKFRSVTPIDTGNARNSTELRGNEIVGNYEYASRLQDGSSSQAPNGMRDPTIEDIRRRLNSL